MPAILEVRAIYARDVAQATEILPTFGLPIRLVRQVWHVDKFDLRKLLGRLLGLAKHGL